MYAQNQFYSRTKHLLISTRGSKWRDINLVMFTVYIDDSGTAPDQNVAIASALVIPAKRIEAMDKEWGGFMKKEVLTSLHASECAAKNVKKGYGDWSQSRIDWVFSQSRRIAKKYSVHAISIAVNKDFYDEIVTGEIRAFAGEYHYTFAMRHVLHQLDKWADNVGMMHPFEYVYDFMQPNTPPRIEVEKVMAQAEFMNCEVNERGRGRYTNYSFRLREDVPGLQCVDTLAWTCYRYALFKFHGNQLTSLQKDCWKDYVDFKNSTWLHPLTQSKLRLAEWRDGQLADGRWKSFHDAWSARSGIIAT